jgi:tetratricopeptide (TPR) repeat protein
VPVTFEPADKPVAARSGWQRFGWVLAGLLLAPLTQAQFSSHLVDIIDARRSDDHTDITIQFTCTMRYVSHAPADSGLETTVRFRPGPDCGLGPLFSGVSEIASVSGTDDLMKNARLEDGGPGEVNLVIGWNRSGTYFVAPRGDQRGFVIRVLHPKRKGDIQVQETIAPGMLFAVNLDAKNTPYGDDEIKEISQAFNTPAYVSPIELDGVTWYRLRIGPFAGRADAQRRLDTALSRYPRAWLVIGEESSAVAAEPAAGVPPAAMTVVDAPLPEAERTQLLADAKTAMQQRKFTVAVDLLTKLVRQPEYTARVEAQELLGLARERSGQLAHAKSEYEEYLRRYPNSEGADRVRLRLHSLLLAGRKTAGGASSFNGGRGAPGWSYSGGLAQMYRWDSSRITSTGQTFDPTSQNALLNYADFLGRYRGERYDFLTRTYAGYTKTLQKNFSGSDAQVNSAFVELTDKRWDMTGRAGRQTLGSDGVFGTFDGARLSYRILRGLTLNATYGYPVDTVGQGVKTDRQFAALSADFGTFWNSLDFSTYALEQRFEGRTDRRAVGLQTRWFRPGQSLIALVDYDVFYRSLNEATIIGNVSLPAQFLLSLDLDRRNTPILTTRNALIGQPVTTLNDLAANFTAEEINQLARDRTSLSTLYSVTLSRPLGERYQVSVDIYSTSTGATPASGNVPALAASGTDRAVQLQLFGTSLFRRSDLHVLSIRYDKNQLETIESVGISSRLPIFGEWRIGPRLRVDRINFASEGSRETAFSPSLRLERLGAHLLLEFEAGSGISSRDIPQTFQNQQGAVIPPDTQKIQSYYISLGYRWGF